MGDIPVTAVEPNCLLAAASGCPFHPHIAAPTGISKLSNPRKLPSRQCRIHDTNTNPASRRAYDSLTHSQSTPRWSGHRRPLPIPKNKETDGGVLRAGHNTLGPRVNHNRISKQQPTPAEQALIHHGGGLPSNLQQWQDLLVAHRQTYGELVPRVPAVQVGHWAMRLGQLDIRELDRREPTPETYKEC